MWTKQNIEFVRGISSKNTASQISEILAKKKIFVSRNAVIGMCSRNGIDLCKMRSPWPSEKVSILRDLVKLKLTSSEISARLLANHKIKASPQLVVGMCKKHGIKLAYEQGRSPNPRKTTRRFLQEYDSYEQKTTKSLFDIKSGECGEIIGEPKHFRCCGEKTNGGVYCEYHAARNYLTNLR